MSTRLISIVRTLTDLAAFSWTLASLVLLSSVSTAVAEESTTATKTPPIQLLQVDERVYLGILNRDADTSLALRDFGVVVDLRYPYEGAYTELAKLRRSSVQYINIPTSSSFPSRNNMEALEKILTDFPTEKILIHDSNGHRSATLWAAHLVDLGTSVDEAVAQVSDFFPAKQAKRHIVRYEQERQKKAIVKPADR